MSATIIRLADRGRTYRPHAAPFDPNWWIVDYLDACARLFGGMAAALEDTRDGAPSDSEPAA